MTLLTRPHSPYMDSVLGQQMPVLDHGFIRCVDYMGDMDAIVQAARVSYGTGTKTAQDDRGLVRYLLRNWHTTPFEMCEIKLHVKLPIFIARQWIRHRTANVNEYSARYSILDKEYYIPEASQLAIQSTTNKQGKGDILDPGKAAEVMGLLRDNAEHAYDGYSDMIEEQETGGYGLARELARMNLTLNTYTQWYWKVDLHNLLHFLRLRMDPHAQYEIRAYADVIATLVQGWMPEVWQAFEDYRLNAVTLSGPQIACMQRMNGGEFVTTPEQAGLTKREFQELLRTMNGRDYHE